MLFPYFLICALATRVTAIWPVPTTFTHGSTSLWIDSTVKITYNGGNLHRRTSYTNTSSAFNSKDIVWGAVQPAMDAILKDSIIPWKLMPRGQLASFEPSADSAKTFITELAITQNGTDTNSTFKPLAGTVDESYRLEITVDGKASISAVSSTGVLHGLQTFTQLFYKHSSGDGSYTNLAPVCITDAPKFSHRGLNMDVARNWYPVEDILRTIYALSINKFNRLHLHVTDSQSWPIEIPALPELAEKGSFEKGLTYSPEDITRIQTYAISVGVEVILEMDMPGHTTSIGLAYPDLIAAYKASPWDTYCAEPPCGSLRLNDTAVPKFLDTLFADLFPRILPYSAYFHTGGDEVNANTYLLDPSVKSNDKKVIASLLQKFLDRNHDQIRAAGLTPVVWEEMFTTWNLTLGKDVLVQSWESDTSVTAITAAGHKALAGNYNYWYLDCGKGQWINFDNGPSFQKYYPFADYCSPTKNWRLMYSYDPLAGVPAAQHSLVMGGEVHIWSEQTDPVNFDDVVWPRASAAGEVLWSGRQDASGTNRSQIDAAPRLAEMRERMVARGIGAGPVQMIYCTQSDATECAL